MLRNLNQTLRGLSLQSSLQGRTPFVGRTLVASQRQTKAIHTSTFVRKSKEPEEGKIVQPKVGASSLFEQADLEASSKSGKEPSQSILDLAAMTGKSPISSASDKLAKKEFRYSTANFKTSPKKLRFLAKQIAGLPINEAIEQMQHSPKRSAEKIKNTLAFARKNAIYQKQMHPDNTYIAEAWVGKGKYTKRIDIKARGRFGIMHHPTAHMKFVLKEKQPEKTLDELFVNGVRDKGLRRKVRGFGLRKSVWFPLQENKPVYNPKPYYNW